MLIDCSGRGGGWEGGLLKFSLFRGRSHIFPESGSCIFRPVSYRGEGLPLHRVKTDKSLEFQVLLFIADRYFFVKQY